MSTVTYEVKKPILGFEEIESVNLEKNDGITSVLSDPKSGISITLLNTFVDGDGFDVPASVKALLDMNDNTNFSVYFVVVLNKSNLQNSSINLGAPMIFNEDNKTMAQVAINSEIGTVSELFNA
ncbi:flagellar assembly protein FliW [Arcobacter sp. FWKO B]|uniref:flagellar assembly protein FliW n=1 Tax=Arcobacter sp. FWKO B TaxID=2593672 RepID=UPI0018A5C0A5|nr:flagellar assembly protein FliW [Arcobacter sp. FWKO B]QOG12990.1 flagellar biosynthesis protein FliW [Arcobacter sp. FWKO B]